MSSTQGISSQNQASSTSTNIKRISISDQVKNLRPPPITLINQDTKDISRLIAQHLNSENFNIKKISMCKQVLYMQNITEFNSAKKLLVQAKTQFYTFTPKIEKMQNFLLKGLSSSYSTEEVLKELN